MTHRFPNTINSRLLGAALSVALAGAPTGAAAQALLLPVASAPSEPARPPVACPAAGRDGTARIVARAVDGGTVCRLLRAAALSIQSNPRIF